MCRHRRSRSRRLHVRQRIHPRLELHDPLGGQLRPTPIIEHPRLGTGDRPLVQPGRLLLRQRQLRIQRHPRVQLLINPVELLILNPVDMRFMRRASPVMHQHQWRIRNRRLLRWRIGCRVVLPSIQPERPSATGGNRGKRHHHKPKPQAHAMKTAYHDVFRMIGVNTTSPRNNIRQDGKRPPAS